MEGWASNFRKGNLWSSTERSNTFRMQIVDVFPGCGCYAEPNEKKILPNLGEGPRFTETEFTQCIKP